MPGIDSLLRMLVDNAADELRLASDAPPRMLKRGAPVRLSIPPTPDDILRHLLGPLFDEHAETLESAGKVELRHTLGRDSFAMTMQKKGAGMEVVFRRGVAPSPPSPPPRPAAPPPIAPAPIASVPIAPPPLPVPMAPEVGRNAADRPIGSVMAQWTLTPQLHMLLGRAVTLGASDVHLAHAEPPTLRIDGRLRTLDDAPHDVQEWLAGVVDEAAVQRALEGRSVDLAFAAPELGRFRLNLYRAAGQLAAAIRILPARVPSLAELHLPSLVEEVVAQPHGLIIVCGPTGSGKSATLAALAEVAMRRRPGLTLTLEDPVEYLLTAGPGSLVRQRQVGRDVVDFATGLRDALREDPDVLLIGEMRDQQSMSLAITAAETGHLVLTSLHARSAAASVERMVDSYPPERQQQIRVQLADALRAVVAQRLIPRARGEGRVPAVEILRLSHAVASMLREGRTEQIPSAMQAGRKEGMVPLERSLAELVRAGQVAREQAFAVANDTATLSGYLQD
jgi:twitching motility protein PilT